MTLERAERRSAFAISRTLASTLRARWVWRPDSASSRPARGAAPGADCRIVTAGPRRGAGPARAAGERAQISSTLVACGPRGPWVVISRTRC